MVKTLKTSSPEPIDRWPWNLICSIVYVSTIKIVQIIALGWHWPILRQGQIWSHWLLYWKSENYLFFRNYCSLRSQSCLNHSAKWVYEVGWVSKVKVILWPWSKVTQISKLKLVFFSKTVGRFVTKVHMKAWRKIGMKINSNELGHMTNMAAMPIYNKKFKKSSSPEPIDWWPRNMVCSIVYVSTTKIVQIISLGWPWPI